MMAQPRHRNRASDDPRNMRWVNDQEKIGMKLMQQMGWKGSEGLGKKGQGRTTHVSVKMKKSMAGVGADEKTDYNWLATQDAFSDVLAGLSSAVASENGEVVTVAAQSSADGKSAFVSRRARMLYGRFKRSKDLTLYNEDDLGCVLGKKEKRPAHLRAAEEEAAAAQPALGNGVHEDNISGVKTITRSTSMADYFAQKLAGKRGSSATTPADSATSTPALSQSTSDAEDDDVPRGKRQKKDDDAEEDEEEAVNGVSKASDDEEDGDDASVDSDERPRRKKSKKDRKDKKKDKKDKKKEKRSKLKDGKDTKEKQDQRKDKKKDKKRDKKEKKKDKKD